MTKDLLQCALGVHRYDKKIEKNWFRCSICKRAEYCIYSDGDEYWMEYDEKGREIQFRNYNGYEYWKEYDGKGNMIHFKDSNGHESWHEYDEYGREVRCGKGKAD